MIEAQPRLAPMYPRVTAIVVARNGGDHLRRTLDALKAQTRQPEAIVAIDCASTGDAAQILAEFGPTHLVSVRENLPFGAAISTAVRVTAPPQADDEWLWLLAQDTAPEPGALEALIGAVEVSPSVAVAGAKQVDWDDATFIREFGEAMTPLGASIPLVENELDQAQHDDLSDVLAVAPGGLLVRHTIWEKLGGFDPALPVVDDGLDFCIRVRLAGYRVVLVPAARLGTAGDGVAGPSRSLRGSVRRRLARERRAAQLHRRMVYASAGVLPIHWLSLVPLAIARSIGRVFAKDPGAIGGELAAAFRTAFAGIRIGAARRNLARNRVVGWAAIAPLRVPLAEVRRARSLKKEAANAWYVGERRELNFFSGGGAWTVLGMAVLGIGLFVSLLGAQALAGGSLLPLSSTVGQLWQSVGYGWRDIGLGFVGAADPFSAVLAVLGSVTFWQPSFALVLVYFVALPLSALGAWLCASRLTERAGLRAFAAIAWAIAPMLLTALQTGRPTAILTHILLPWLFFAGIGAARSWGSSAVTALLAAATIACAPSLAPALVVVWIIALVLSGRGIGRLLFLPIPALALFAPLIWQQGARGAWISLLADPGVPQLVPPTHAAQFVVGFPGGSLGGWVSIGASLGMPNLAAQLVIPVLLAPIGVLAILALFLRGSGRAIFALAVALLGFATAVAAVQISVTVDGSVASTLWPGSGLSLYWLGLVGAATIGLGALGRFAVAPAWIALVALMVAVAPIAIAMPLGTSDVTASGGQTLPAVISADASTHPRVGTLLMASQTNGGISAQLVRGGGATLNQQSTLSSTSRSLDSGERDLAQLAGNLASQSGFDASAQLSKLGIRYVLVAPGAVDQNGQEPSAAKTTDRRTQTALDGNPLLTPIGQTPNGMLWSFASGQTHTPPAALVPPNAGGPLGTAIGVGQAIVIGLTLLLAIPTGRKRGRFDPIATPNRRRKRDRTSEDGPSAVGVDPEPDGDEIDAEAAPERDTSLDDSVADGSRARTVSPDDAPDPGTEPNDESPDQGAQNVDAWAEHVR
jgi:GT2 family glycosyltransferase